MKNLISDKVKSVFNIDLKDVNEELNSDMEKLFSKEEIENNPLIVAGYRHVKVWYLLNEKGIHSGVAIDPTILMDAIKVFSDQPEVLDVFGVSQGPEMGLELAVVLSMVPHEDLYSLLTYV